MCGIISFSGQNNFDVEKIKVLILWNSLERGEDSTGIYSPLNGLKKTLKRGSEVIIDPKFNIIPDTFLLGHVRASTIGVKSENNAHPFQKGNYTLIHNGTLKNHWALLKKYNLKYADYNVDSEILTGCIEASDSFTPIKEIEGAAALVINDDRIPNRIYVFKNADRPLFKGMIDNNMYISSIEDSLVFIGCKNVKTFKDNTLYTIEQGRITDTRKIKNTPYVAPPTVNINNITTKLKYAWKSWVRANSTITYCIQPEHFKLVKDQYYYIDNVVNDNTVSLYDPSTKLTHNINMYNINMSDLIEVNDYVKVITDVYSRTDRTKKVANVGDILIVSMVYTDGDISLKEPLCNTFLTMTTKTHVRKLTFSERDIYFKTENIPWVQDRFLESLNMPEESTVDIITSNFQNTRQLSLIAPMGTEVEVEEVDEPIVEATEEDEESNYIQQLSECFYGIIGTAEALRILINKETITNPEVIDTLLEVIDIAEEGLDTFVQ